MRAKLQVLEKVQFDHYIEVEVENEELLDAADKHLDQYFDDLEEVCQVLGHVEGVKIVDVCRDGGGMPDETEVLGWYDQRN